jgi:hypothetical protein
MALLGLCACSAGQQQTLAHITERRLKNNGKLQVSYAYHAGEKLVADSAELPVTTIVPHDSVTVVFSSKEPGKSSLLVP